MSESEDSGPGRREVAHRLFAAEFDDAEFSYSESDEERAPNYVVTPTGARVNRLFVVGVLTELEQVNEEVLRARIVDPTGPFVVYAGQYQPEALAFLEAATPPLFVAITGKARTFEPDDSDRVFTSIRPESISEVDAETRDRWVVQAAEQTVQRVGRMASAKQSGATGDALQEALTDAGVSEADAAGMALALDYYGTTGAYLEAVRDIALDSARVVAGERDEAGALSLAPDDGTDGPAPTLATMDVDAAAGEAGEQTTGDETVTTTETSPTTDTASGGEAAPVDAGTSDDTDVPESADTAGSDDTGEPEPASTGTGATSTSSEPPAPDETPSTETESPDSTTTAEPTPATSEPETPESSASSETAGQSVTESTDTLGDFEQSDAASDEGSEPDGLEESDDVGDFDTEFELDEQEREEIEQEYGTDFQSGTEVDDAGEADIETPDPEELAEMEADAADTSTGGSDAAVAETAGGDESSTDTGAGGGADTSADAAAGEPAEDVDLEDAVMDAMTGLDDGGGADREAVISTVVDDHGVAREDVEDAIQDALMGGRCYEPDDGKLTPI